MAKVLKARARRFRSKRRDEVDMEWDSMREMEAWRNAATDATRRQWMSKLSGPRRGLRRERARQSLLRTGKSLQKRQTTTSAPRRQITCDAPSDFRSAAASETVARIVEGTASDPLVVSKENVRAARNALARRTVGGVLDVRMSGNCGRSHSSPPRSLGGSCRRTRKPASSSGARGIAGRQRCDGVAQWPGDAYRIPRSAAC